MKPIKYFAIGFVVAWAGRSYSGNLQIRRERLESLRAVVQEQKSHRDDLASCVSSLINANSYILRLRMR